MNAMSLMPTVSGATVPAPAAFANAFRRRAGVTFAEQLGEVINRVHHETGNAGVFHSDYAAQLSSYMDETIRIFRKQQGPCLQAIGLG